MKMKAFRPISRFHGKGRSITPGAAPGTLVADPNAQRTIIRFYGSSPDSAPEEFEENEISDPGQLPDLLKRHATLWIDVVGLGDLETIEKLGEIFGLHRLALEDVMNVNQRPKLEEFEDKLFIVTRYNSLAPRLESEQISLFVGPGYVLSFQEREGDCFEGVRDRFRKGKGRIRISGDYLAYALIDSIVDHNFPLLESYGDRLEDLEDLVTQSPDEDTVGHINRIKRDLAAIRRSVWPLRDVLSTLLRGETDYFTGDNAPFLRDCYDHVLQVVDLVEHYREVASGLVDMYMSTISNNMNDVMRLLTLIATIFIPLGFVAGLYGMNFNSEISPWNMPELSLRYGYPMALGLMAAIAISMLIYFRYKGWIGKRGAKKQ